MFTEVSQLLISQIPTGMQALHLALALSPSAMWHLPTVPTTMLVTHSLPTQTHKHPTD